MTDFERGVEAMREMAIAICEEEMWHADTHLGDIRYADRKNGAHACLLGIRFAECKPS